MTFDKLFRLKHPVIPKRGVHLDLKGTPPTAGRLVRLLKVFSAARYNVVLVEWEDSFPWTVDRRFRSRTAYTIKDIRRFMGAAARLGIEVIPLVQCLGHMETPLRVRGYEHLREIPDDSFVMNPLAPGARELVQSMVDDVLNVIPEVRHFHLGGDEVWTMGKHPKTRAYIKRHGKGALYLHHVGPILDNLNRRGIRPILWHDMMINWDSRALKALAARSDLLTWGYAGHPDTTGHHFNTKYIRRFHDHGFTLWGGTAYKGADGHNIDLPDIARRQENAAAWVEVARRFNFTGVIATAWSRYSTDRIQCEPIDAALDSLVNVGVIMHDGHPPKGGIKACVQVLNSLGEKKRFEACKTAMEHLVSVRRSGWQAVQSLREQLTLYGMDARRRGSKAEVQNLNHLRNVVKDSEKIAAEVRKSFAGLLEPVWIEEYLATRLIPLRDELAGLDATSDR